MTLKRNDKHNGQHSEEYSDDHIHLHVEYTSDMRLVVRYPRGRTAVEKVEIPQGASVFWDFSGLPRDLVQDWVPAIHFEDGSPFAVLKANHRGVWGLENLGESGTFEFQAAWSDWRPPRLSRLVSDPVLLWQKAMSIDIEVNLEAQTFSVDPKYCRITAGTPVLWRFPNLDSEHQAQIRFGYVSRAGQTIPQPNTDYFGPFRSMSRTPEGLLGEGSGPDLGQYSYIVEVSRKRETNWGIELQSAFSEDPVIDNEEEPPAEDPETP